MTGKQWLARYGGWGCGCMALTLPHIEADMIAAGVIHTVLDFKQLCYHLGVAASAGTHDLGGVADGLQMSPTALAIWKKWGCFPNHRVPPIFPYQHNHVLWVGCPHHAPLAAEQVHGALARGWNGLGTYGRTGGAERYGVWDYVPKITWQQAYAKYVTSRPVRKPPAPKPPAPKPPNPPAPPIGVLGMSQTKSTGPGRQVQLRAGVAEWLPLDQQPAGRNGVSILGSPTKLAMIRALVEVGGLQPGEKVAINFVVVEHPSGKELRVCHRRGLPSNDRFEHTYVGAVPAASSGQAPRLRIRVYTNSATATVQLIELDGGYE